MELAAAQKIAIALMKKHGITDKGWKFKFDNAKKRLGLCTYNTKTISVSRYMVGAATEAQATQAILHEIAHAMVPYSAKHSHIWVAQGRAIGYTGGRTARNPYHEAQVALEGDAFSNPATVFLATPIRENDTIVTRNGKSGIVTKIARTRYHFKVPNGTIWSIPFSMVRKIAEGDIGLVPATRAVQIPLSPGVPATRASMASNR